MDSVGPNSNENPNIDNSFGFSLFSSMFDTGQMNAKVETLLQGNNNPGNAESPSLVTGVEWYVRRNESPAVGTDYQFAVGKSGWDPGTFTGNQDASDAALVLDIYSKKRNLVMRGTEFICIVASLPYMIKGPSATTYQGNTVGVGLYVDGYYSSDLGNLIPFFPVT
ncbi:hypothetical protein F4Y93_10860 [Candidatus Poribacteria bacterium]|nr:hypothetical protein [Candidatus Poribacteria bacterium]